MNLFGHIKQPDDTPLVAPGELLEGKRLTSVLKGSAGGYDFDLMADEKGRVTIFVNFGKSTGLHIVAIGDQSRLAVLLQERVKYSLLVPVELEGDFPDYFKLFVNPNREVEIRQLFDPEQMQNFVDFCRSYDLEIFYDGLYISEAQGVDGNAEHSTMATDMENFLAQNTNLLKALQREQEEYLETNHIK